MSGAGQAMKDLLLWTLDGEPQALAGKLPPAEALAFSAYYRSLPVASDRAAVERFLRGFRHGEAGYVARRLAARPGLRVLDAGCGFGTYSMLYAALGAEVIGADLRPDRLEVAERRKTLYRERFGRELNVRYLRADLTREWPGAVDVVWIYNALSHIHPIGDFMAAARRALSADGVIVVGDINGAFLPHRRRLDRQRQEVYSDYVAPDGTRHAYAVEKTFTPREMREAFTSHGFQVLRHELYWGGLGRAGDGLYFGVLEPLGRLWWLGGPVARRQLLVAGGRGVRA